MIDRNSGGLVVDLGNAPDLISLYVREKHSSDHTFGKFIRVKNLRARVIHNNRDTTATAKKLCSEINGVTAIHPFIQFRSKTEPGAANQHIDKAGVLYKLRGSKFTVADALGNFEFVHTL